MTIKKIKEELINHIGKNATIKCDLGRNKFEEYVNFHWRKAI